MDYESYPSNNNILNLPLPIKIDTGMSLPSQSEPGSNKVRLEGTYSYLLFRAPTVKDSCMLGLAASALLAAGRHGTV